MREGGSELKALGWPWGCVWVKIEAMLSPDLCACMCALFVSTPSGISGPACGYDPAHFVSGLENLFGHFQVCENG